MYIREICTCTANKTSRLCSGVVVKEEEEKKKKK